MISFKFCCGQKKRPPCKIALNQSNHRDGIESSKSKSKSKIGFFDLSSYRSELESWYLNLICSGGLQIMPESLVGVSLIFLVKDCCDMDTKKKTTTYKRNWKQYLRKNGAFRAVKIYNLSYVNVLLSQTCFIINFQYKDKFMLKIQSTNYVERHYVFDLITRFVCLCVCVNHSVCEKMAGRSNT